MAIVGAGPAGSTLAALLAGRGLAVALIDRDAFPRDKLCGEFLSYDALPIAEMLGIDLSTAPEIARCRIVSRNRTYEFDFPHAARGVSRLFLDHSLHHRAVAAGATAVTSPAIAVARNGVETEQGAIRARVVVGAWGRWGRFDQQLRRKFVRDRSHRNFGFKRHYRGDVSDTIELYSFRRGYLGVSPVEGGITNICGLVHATRIAHLKGRWDAFIESIRGEEPRLEAMYARHQPAQDGFLSSEPVIFRGRSAVVDGIFMIGDASGVIDPLTGNGMAMAMQSALVAAPFILSECGGKAAALEYQSKYAEMFLPRIAWSRRVAYLLSRPALLDAALALRSRAAGPFLLRHTRGARDEIRSLVDVWQR